MMFDRETGQRIGMGRRITHLRFLTKRILKDKRLASLFLQRWSTAEASAVIDASVCRCQRRGTKAETYRFASGASFRLILRIQKNRLSEKNRGRNGELDTQGAGAVVVRKSEAHRIKTRHAECTRCGFGVACSGLAAVTGRPDEVS